MQMTKTRYRELTERRDALVEEHQHTLRLISEAAGLGDLSENEEYATARAAEARVSNELSALEARLAEAEIVDADTSPRITIGSVIEVCKVNKNHEDIEEPRRFTFESEGDTILQGILGAESSLGKAIFNGNSGFYDIPDNGGLTYRVKKIIGE